MSNTVGTTIDIGEAGVGAQGKRLLAGATEAPSRSQMMAYSAPVVASYFLLGPTFNIVPALYAKYFGLELTLVATLVLCTRLFDAVTDPVIGYLSDRHRMAGGSRKVWVIAGGLLLIVAAWFLFVPPAQPSAAYYLYWSLGFFLAFTLMEIPHLTWGGELTNDYTARSAVYGYRAAAVFIGYALWAGFPLLPWYESKEFTPEVLRDVVCVCLAVMLTAVAWAVWRAPRGHVTRPRRRDSGREILRSVVNNKPLRLLSAAYLIGAAGFGMWQGLVFIYLDSHMNLGGKFALMQLSSNVVGLLAIPVWKHITPAFNKSTVWFISLALFMVTNAGFLGLGPNSDWRLALMLMALVHACFSCLYMMLPAMLGDVVDYGQWKFHHNRGATYFALANLIAKLSLGGGAALALGIAGYFGVDPAARQQTGEAVWGLQLAFVIVPVALVFIAAVLILRMPINRRRHSVIRRRLESRNEQSSQINGGHQPYKERHHD